MVMMMNVTLGDRRRDAALATAAAVVATAALAWYHRRRRQRQQRAKEAADAASSAATDDEPAPAIASVNRSAVPPDAWRSFEEAAHRVRADRALARRLTSGDRLMFYGLYKHIVSGDAPARMSLSGGLGFNVAVGQAKHAAWARMRGIPVEAAITHYRAAVRHFADRAAAVADDNPSNSTAEEAETAAAAETIPEEDAAAAGDDDGTGGFGPAPVSRPAVENGGIAEDDGSGGASAEAQLLRAAGRSDAPTLRSLLQGKVDVNHQDESGQTALHLAADRGSADCVEALLAAGADANAADHDGISVLQAAVIAGHAPVCRLLLDRGGADPDQPDADGDTPRSCARDDDDDGAVRRLFASLAPAPS